MEAVKENPPQGDPEEILEVEQRLIQLSVKRKNLCGAEKMRRKRALLLQAAATGDNQSSPIVASGSCKRRKGSQDAPTDRAAKRQRALETQGPSYTQVAGIALTRVLVTSCYSNVC